MLDRDFFARYRVIPDRLFEGAVTGAFRAMQRATGTRLEPRGFMRPAEPVIFASNSTQKYDFMPLRAVAPSLGLDVVTVTKAKNYHSAMRPVLERTGVVPIGSKGYVLAIDFAAVHGRRPDEREYRALRGHLDRGEPLPDGAVFEALQRRPRAILGHWYSPSLSAYRDVLREVYRAMMAETVRLAREARDAGFSIHMYPEGTVSSRLSVGRNGVVQLAHALGMKVAPLSMNGCREVFVGQSAALRGGVLELCFGDAASPDLSALPAGFRPFDPDDEQRHRAALQAATDEVMGRIEALLWPSLRRQEGFVPDGTSGVRRFL